MKLFKEMYKRANDSIPTSDAKARVMANLKKPPVRNPYKEAARIGALAACLVFTFAATSVYKKYEREKVPVLIENSGKTVQNYEEPTVFERETEKPVEKINAEATEKPRKTALKKETPVAEKIKNDEITVNTEKEEVKNNETVNIVINSEKEEISEAVMMAREITPRREVSLEEYYDYIGKNIEECLVLPENFENITQDTAFFETDENGDFKSDEWSFMFVSEEKYAEIITTKNTEEIKKRIDDETYVKSTVCGKDAVVTENEYDVKAYAVSEEIGYKITACGLEEFEFENLLVSAIK